MLPWFLGLEHAPPLAEKVRRSALVQGSVHEGPATGWVPQCPAWPSAAGQERPLAYPSFPSGHCPAAHTCSSHLPLPPGSQSSLRVRVKKCWRKYSHSRPMTRPHRKLENCIMFVLFFKKLFISWGLDFDCSKIHSAVKNKIWSSAHDMRNIIYLLWPQIKNMLHDLLIVWTCFINSCPCFI